MKIQFKLIGTDGEVWADRDNVLGQCITMQPNTYTLKFVSIDQSIELSIKLDERNKLAAHLANQLQNEIFEFDFSQSIPEKRLNPPL